MNKLLLILILIISTINCYSQNDSLYLEQEYVLLNGVKLNQIEKAGEKTGEWIQYDWNYPDNIIPLNFLLASGDGFHEYSTTSITYRPLNENEHNGIRLLLSERIDSTKADLYYHTKYMEIRNIIPPDLLCIKNRGNYSNGLKHGIWNYYYCSDSLKKRIKYSEGKPDSDYEIYREDGTVMVELSKINDSVWEVSKYTKEGELIEIISDEIEKFEMLYKN